MAVTNSMRVQIAQLYVSLFGRAPEIGGLDYWVAQLEAGTSWATIAQAMYNTTPARATYPLSLTNDEIVTKFYVNVLGRTPDADGLKYWSAKLTTKTPSNGVVGQVIAEMITAVVSYNGTDAAALESQSLFNSKTTVGLNYALGGGTDPNNTVLNGVTSEASKVAASTAAAATAATATAAATTAATAATAAAAAVDTTATAAATAATAAAATDAVALKVTSDAAKAAADAAVVTAATKATAVTTAQAALTAAIAGGNTTAINEANAQLLIAQAAKTTADAAVTSTAATAATALAATTAAEAADKAAADAATAAAKAVADAKTAADAAVTAATAATAAAAANTAAAAATASTTDDAAAKAAADAATAAATAAAAAKATTEVLTLKAAYDTAKAASDAAATASSAAATAAAAAVTGADSLVKANAAITAAAAQTAAAATAASTAASTKAAADAYAAAAAKTAATTDDTAAAAAVAAAAAQVTAATAATAAAGTQTTAAAALPAKFVATNFVLTTGVDTIVGGAGNDTITGMYGELVSGPFGPSIPSTNNTFTPLDVIDGGAGAGDTLTLNQVGSGDFPLGTTVKNVEIVNINAATSANVNTSAGFTGVTNLNVTAFAGGTVTGGTEAIAVVNKSTNTDLTVNNGSSQTISAVYGNVTSNDATGAVSVTHTKLGTNSIYVNDGAAVTVVASGVGGNVGPGFGPGSSIVVGEPEEGTYVTGAVNITSTGAAYEAAMSSPHLANIYVNGGSTVTVNQVATSDATAAKTDGTVTSIYQGDVSVAGKNTTEVTVNQSSSVLEPSMQNAREAVAAVQQTHTVKFTDMTAGQSVTIEGLTFTAAKALTAIEAAAAFANVYSWSTNGYAPASNGIYTGELSSTYFAKATSTDTVTFVDRTSTGTPAALSTATSGGYVITAAAGVTGVNGVSALTGIHGVEGGTVTITDDNTVDTISKVTLSGYGSSSSISSDALTTLSLSNVRGSDLSLSGAGKSLDLSISNVGSSSYQAYINANTLETLNVTTGATSSRATLNASSLKALNVGGASLADLRDSGNITSLETLVVKGTAGVRLHANSATALKSVDTTATTGTVTTTIDTTKATYAGGAGVDNVTTANTTAATKAITLGAGNDTLSLKAGSQFASTVAIDGGDGTDTLVMAAADAAAVSGNVGFASKLNSFEVLSLGASTVANTVDLSNMNNIKHVISAGSSGGTGGTTESGSVEFSGLKSGQSITVAGLTLTATGGDLTADQVAEALDGDANGLSTSVTAVPAAVVTGTLTGFTAGAIASGSTVVYTSTTPSTDVTNLATSVANATAPTAPVATIVQGINAQTETSFVTFGSLLEGETVTVAGRTVTATGGTLTGAQVATAITAPSNGTYGFAVVSGTLSNFNTSGLTGNQVTYTHTTANSNQTDIVVSSNTFLPSVSTTQGAAATYETASVVFSALKSGQSVTVAGLTFTANADLSAIQVAEVFDSLTAGATTVVGAAGTFAGTFTAFNSADNGDTATVVLTAGGSGNVVDLITPTAAVATLPTAVVTPTNGVPGVGGGSLSITKMANNGTLELTGSNTGTTTVTMTDATSLTADSLNIVTKVSASTINFGTVAVAGVETINFNAVDLDTSYSGGYTNYATLNVNAADVKSIVVTGNSHVTLTANAANIALTSIDASKVTGEFYASTLATATAGATVKGGSYYNELTSNHSSDVLIGGASGDILQVNAGANLVTLTGGDGDDTFHINGASTNVNSYATITDLNNGDNIKFTGADSFRAAKIQLGATAVFQDYANAAVNQTGTTAGDLSWFTFEGNTYIVMSSSAQHGSFTNGADLIVKIAGVKDLSKSSFNDTYDNALYIM